MKLKKLLALTLTGAVLTASLTACTPLDAAELVYDSIFGGGSSSTGSGNNGSTGGTTGSGSTAEEAENRAVAAACVKSWQSRGSAYKNIDPVYDIPYLEDFVKAIDVYCTNKSKRDNKSWEETVWYLSTTELNDLATVLHKENYGNVDASIRFGKDIQGTPEQKANSFPWTCRSFWDTKQSTPYKGNAWFDSVVLTRADGSTYRFLLSICHG